MTGRVGLTALSRSRPHGLHEALWADRLIATRLSLDETDDHTIALTSASVANQRPTPHESTSGDLAPVGLRIIQAM